MKNVIVKTQALKKYYQTGNQTVRALDGVNFEVAEREFVSIVGKSGSGKSTLLHMIGGLDTPSSGTVIVDGLNLETLNSEQLALFRRRKVGFIFQQYNLIPDLNVYDNVIDNLYMDWKCGEITRAEYVRMKAKFEAKADSMKNAIVNLKAEIELSSKGVGNNDPYLQMFLKHKNITELNRGILAELIDTIYIHENNEITIKFNFADQHKRLLDFISNNQNTSKKEGRVYTLPSLSKSTLAV